MNDEYDLFVIGAGSGGVRCARIAASLGARVGIAENRHWGGTCVNLGCVPKKMMVYASQYEDFVEDSHGFGWDTQPGQHSWKKFLEVRSKEISRLNGIYVSMLEKAGVTLHVGRASFEDAHTLLITPDSLDPSAPTQRITAKKIVIATGSRPYLPAKVEGIEHVITSDEAFHLAERPQRLCIVGSGYIGVEFASIFAGLGSEVHHVYRQNLPLRGFDRDIRQCLHEAIAQRGIKRHDGASPVKIEKQGAVYKVELDTGSVIEVDCVFYATGRNPNIERLGLEKAGIETEKSGHIKIDAQQRTSQQGVYAIGDVSNRLNLTPVAIAEGHRLAENLFGAGPARAWSLATTPKAVFFSPPIGSVGLTEEEAAEKGDIDVYVSHFTPMRNTISGRPCKTFIKLVVDTHSQKVVGIHMFGDDAAEIMQGMAIALTAGLTKQDFDRTVGIHPTSAEEFVTMRTVSRQVKKTDSTERFSQEEVES